jgi:hypothetical protein
MLTLQCGEGVPERTKGYFTSHLAAVAKILHVGVLFPAYGAVLILVLGISRRDNCTLGSRSQPRELHSESCRCIRCKILCSIVCASTSCRATSACSLEARLQPYEIWPRKRLQSIGQLEIEGGAERF